jgi:hypothetical protein
VRLGEFAVKLTLWPDPDGLYLIKGGGPDVWKQFPRIRKDWREGQGVIHGKRCGVSQNLGAAARGRVALKQQERTRGRTFGTYHSLKPKKGGEVYSVIFRGKLLVEHSTDPECDAARALLAKGITGMLTMLDGKTGRGRPKAMTHRFLEWNMGS